MFSRYSSNSKPNFKRFSLGIAAILIAVSFAAVSDCQAAATAALQSAQAANNNIIGDLSGESASTALAIKSCALKVGCVPQAVGYDCTAAFAQMLQCMKDAEKSNADLTNSSQWKEYLKRVADGVKEDSKRYALALAFKASLKTFATTVAHDTAVWVASGGKGQKPLFITEGWGAYVQNAADVALGDFIEGIGTSFGMDLCQPNFQVKLAIKTGLNYTRPRRVTCSFSKIMTNWESAINNASFVLEYKESLRTGANDISYALVMADQRNSYVATAAQTAAKEAEITGLWKNIKNVAGQILTPGTVIADTYLRSQEKADIGYSTFTNTVADIVEEFLNTLVAQLLKNLQNGLFSSSSGGGSSSGSSLDLSSLSALFNSDSSPVVSGIAGAERAYSNLIESQTKVGSSMDIILKLSTCSDSAKANPGPTDCVIDSLLANAIKSKKYAIDLDSSVKNRLFAPQINQKASLENVITARSIMIMREYRIVPIGWEIAANIITDAADSSKFSNFTLSDVMNCFYGKGVNNCAVDDFKGLVDPYWVLKAPETFCRRVGYTGYNALSEEQGAGILRNQDCVDEQQCLQEDNKGNCLDYGYCTQERRTWDIGKTCETKYNTCASYLSRSGIASNWLTDTLDFENCTSQNAGCRSYATDYNYQSKQWNGDLISADGSLKNYSRFLGSSRIEATADPGWRVQAGHIASDNLRLSLGAACSKSVCDKIAGCKWNAAGKYCAVVASCEVPAGGISCYAESCYETDNNRLSASNSNFEDQASGSNAGDAAVWTDELSYSNANNRHYRAVGQGKIGSGLKIISANNAAVLITTLPDVALEAGQAYKLKFSIKGTISQGSVIVALAAGDSLYNTPNSAVTLGGQSFVSGLSSWTDVEMPIINSGNYSSAAIAIITPVGSITNLSLDNFALYKLKSECSAAGVKLFSSPQTTEASNIYLNRNAQTCSADAFGCSQFIRTKADLGNNLLYNGGLEHGLAGWAAQMSPQPEISSGAAVFSTSNSADAAMEIEPDSYYSFSFDAAQISASNQGRAVVSLAAYNTLSRASAQTISSEDTNCTVVGASAVNLISDPDGVGLERVACYFKSPSDAHYLKFRVKAEISPIKIDNLKIEKVSYPNFSATAYSVYDPSSGHGSGQIAYLNQAPDYYGCYKNEGGAWPTTEFELNGILASRATECENFADVCMQSETGCELYKPVSGDPEIPGIIDGLDLCPSECSGYQVYKQEATNFIVSDNFKQFIADSNAKYCSSAYAGCDEFTNLDTLGQGAENKEYYVNFKICQHPSADDASYYTWEGSDITGYQLKAFILKKSKILDPINNSQGYAPCTDLAYNADGTNYCQDQSTGGFCSKDEMADNSDCRELYDTDGNVHYRLLSKTVTASDNCHPYRRTQTQTTVEAAQADCEATAGWWKDATKECIYMAIPSEGTVCSANVSGCRAYTGNRGNNVRNVLSASDFSSATTSDLLWVDGSGAKDGLMISSEATYPGGDSLANKVDALDGTGITNNIIKHKVALLKNHTYILSFWAKANQSFNPDNIMFVSNGAEKDVFSAAKLAGENLISPRILITTEWKRYDLGPVFVTWEPTGDNDYLSFKLPGGAKIYLDNIVLKELNNNVFAIENSWYTPVSCDNKLNDAEGKKAIASGDCQDEAAGRCSVGEMLGCAAYKDRSSAVWYLRSFNSLCRRAAAGCEALISTHNSESAEAETYNAGDDNADIGGLQEYDKTSVEADNLIYLVNDGKHACSSANKGCNAFGLPTVDKWDATIGYQTVYLINDPSRYSTDLCQHNALWCEAYTSANSLNYFKDPHGKTCDYVSASGQASGWFKTGTDLPCVPDSTGVSGGSPDTSFGTGYEPASEKIQPLSPYADVLGVAGRNSGYSGFAGNCPAASAGCSEYLDPDPSIYTDFLSPKDRIATRLNPHLAELQLDGYTLYNFTNIATSTIASECKVYRPFGFSSAMYYISGKDKCKITVQHASSLGVADNLPIDSNSKVSKAGVYYALSNSVDNSSCNGLVDFKSGCILANSRNNIDYNSTSTEDRDIDYLTYDSIGTYALNKSASGASIPTSPQMPASGGQADSNIIVKAGANRTCEKWLECTTYQKTSDSSQSYRFDSQDQCLNFGVCDFRDTDGSCRRWETAGKDNITTSTAAFPNNLTGFTLPDQLPVAAMDQFGNSASVPNSNFESAIDGKTPGEPLGWIMNASSSDLNNDGWQSYKYAVEGEAQYLKFDAGYLAVNSIYAVNSESIDVEAGYYALDLWINTLDLKPESAVARVFITSEKINDNVANVTMPRDSGLTTKIGMDEQSWITSDSLKLKAGLKINDNVANVTMPRDSGLTTKIGMDEQSWITSDSLKLKAGLGWTEKTVLIRVFSKDTIKIKLMNFDDEARLSSGVNLDAASSAFNYNKCYDTLSSGKPNYDTSCNITGGSLFDNISLKAVLRITNDSGAELGSASNLPASNELISRSCRAYPAQDARSCQYYSGNNFYYGWYGYCLMQDPENPGQCLQWYPVDQLKGDVVDEYSGGYNDRVPLYYCAEVKKNTVKAQAENFGAGIGGGVLDKLIGGSLSGLGDTVSSLLGDSGKAIPFALSDPATVRLFRYPMIQKFGVSAGAIGAGAAFGHLGGGGMFFYGTMEKYYSCLNLSKGEYCKSFLNNDITTDASETGILGGLLEAFDLIANTVLSIDIDTIVGEKLSANSLWGGWGAAVPAAISQVGLGLPFAGWDLVEDQIMNSGSSSGSAINSLMQQAGISGVYGDGSVMGAKIVTDEDSKYAKEFTDPNKDVAGNILGAVWGVSLGSAALFDINGINISGTYDAYYCTKIVQVATASGQNKAWVNRVSKASQFTFSSSTSDMPTLDSTSPNTSAAPDNFIQTCRVNKEKKTYPFFANPYCLNVAGALDGIDPDKLGYQFVGYSADYKPFGAIVAPQTDSQNPYLWDSYAAEKTTDYSRQPLYWESPTLSGSAPYQARMGQPVLVSGLQNLFAKSYAAWKWVGDDQSSDESMAAEGSYQPINEKSDPLDYNKFIWPLPDNYCDATWVSVDYKDNGYVRDMGDRDHFCLIRPEIITMSVNSSTASLINDNSLGASRPAKLDFTVRVDRDQLPLTSYLVEWGDGELNNTAVTGVKLRARANAENPFTLYHLYDYQKVKDAAGGCTAFSGTATNDPCYLHYCNSDGDCFVRIKVTVTDNWRAENTVANGLSAFVIQVE